MLRSATLTPYAQELHCGEDIFSPVACADEFVLKMTTRCCYFATWETGEQ